MDHISWLLVRVRINMKHQEKNCLIRFCNDRLRLCTYYADQPQSAPLCQHTWTRPWDIWTPLLEAVNSLRSEHGRNVNRFKSPFTFAKLHGNWFISVLNKNPKITTVLDNVFLKMTSTWIKVRPHLLIIPFWMSVSWTSTINLNINLTIKPQSEDSCCSGKKTTT